ncbi:RNA polymerase II associated Paf1 complex subunit Tpr1 [Asimina triloba]
MSSLSRELVFLILQFLDEEKFKETVHKLEQESGFFFNMKYFEEEVHNGNWDEVERYLSGFTKVDDNRYSMKIFFEIRKQKYLEALDKHDRAKAVDILVKDLKVFASFNEELFKEITQLLTLDNFRENEQLSKYGDTKSARTIMLVELKKLIEANPLFRDKLQFPNLKSSSLNWQHQLCKNPRPNPDIKTLFVDHTCGQPNGARAPSPASNPLLGSMPKPGGFPPLGAHGPFQPAPVPVPAPLAGWMSNPSTVAHPAASGGPIGLGAPANQAAILKHPRTPPNNPSVDYPSADSEHVAKRSRPMGISEEVNLPVNILPITYPGQNHGQGMYSQDDLPKNVARTLNQGSSPMSMDFHPIQQTILLVGTNLGDISIWEVGSRERLVLRNFKVWDLGACSMPLQAAMIKEPGVSVNRIIWNPDGTLFGVAYSRHIVQIYAYHGGGEIRQHLEIDAHVGGVNDLAFSHPNKQLCVITCGDDKTIKVWDAATGARQYTFEGHEAPVYSVCPHYKENIQFIFSTALDGKIKAWLYDNLGSRVDYEAPGRWCTTMAYSADGSSKDGESFIVEWNESEGAVKRTYQGFRKRSLGVVQFDTTRNRFLAAGDEFMIKFWDMDNVNLLTTADADGGLPASPRIRFNKEGTLLAVSANDNGIKILGNADGIRLLRTFENRSFVPESLTKPQVSTMSSVVAATSAGLADRGAPVAAMVGMNGDARSLSDVKPRLTDESTDKSKIWKLTEVNEPAQCRSLRLPETMRVNKDKGLGGDGPECETLYRATKLFSHPIQSKLNFAWCSIGISSLTRISRLIYTNSGVAILALASNAIHLLWKWQRNDRTSSGKATASVSPQLWQPPSGILMTNDIADTNPEEAVSCFALSKNDSYVMSASGGKISLFNMMTFKTMTTFMPPPPAATFLAFHPQDNNIIAIGMDDSTIQIYNVRVDEVKSKLKGHSKRITGLAFSNVLNVLVSSGADSQLCVWSTDGWEKQKSRLLQLPAGRTSTALSETRVQFHHDQIHFLAVHETQLAIYESTKLECVKQWLPREGSITHATFSCDSQLVYAAFMDATVCVFNAASLRLRCRISPSSYLPANSISSNVHPLVIAAHPSEPNQFALGLSDGGVHVLEPLESEARWGVPPPPENGSASSSMPTAPVAGASGSDQGQR